MPRPFANIVALLTPKRRWAQFSLGSMLIVITALCVWLALLVNRANRQRHAVGEVRRLGGTALYDYQIRDSGSGPFAPRKRPGPTWLRNAVGVDYVATAVGVYVIGRDSVSSTLPVLKDLPHLRMLMLGLNESPVGDQTIVEVGFPYLQRLKSLRTLELDGNVITDDSVRHLYGMSSLHELVLSRTLVTDEGATELQQALPNCRNIRWP
jgi:hypothetical protein